jgi:hypothetical protein
MTILSEALIDYFKNHNTEKLLDSLELSRTTLNRILKRNK